MPLTYSILDLQLSKNLLFQFQLNPISVFFQLLPITPFHLLLSKGESLFATEFIRLLVENDIFSVFLK